MFSVLPPPYLGRPVIIALLIPNGFCFWRASIAPGTTLGTDSQQIEEKYAIHSASFRIFTS
jgi:hypothetical protein